MKIYKILLQSIFILLKTNLLQAQESIPRHQVSFGYFANSASSKPTTLTILSPSYEYRTPFLKDHLGVGVSCSFVTATLSSQKDVSYGAITNYHFLKDGSVDIYAGIGGAYSTRSPILNNLGSSDSDLSGMRLTYQYGFKFFPQKNIGLSMDLSNYRYSGGLFLTFGLNGRF
jgi:hypothetical protein